VFVTNHVLAGVLVGRALERHPVAAFAVGVGSHLVIDAVPHWGCDWSTEDGEERFLAAARRDGLLGLAALAAGALAVDRKARPAVVAAMAGSVLLDLDKPIEYFFGVYPFPDPVRRIHLGVQNESPRGMPNEVAFGVVTALADALVASAPRRRRRRARPVSPVGGLPARAR
jgi:hypothetical protein